MVERLCRWVSLVGLAVAVTVLGLAMAAADLAVLVVTAPGLVNDLGPAGGLALLAAGIPLTLLLAVAAHEAGHLAAGRALGLDPRLAHVGPVTLARAGGAWRLGWDARRPWVGGRVECGRGWGRNWRTAAFLLAGPAANLVLGVVAGWFLTQPLPPAARCWAGLFAVHSVFLGLANLLPLREGRLESDGLSLLRLLR